MSRGQNASKNETHAANGNPAPLGAAMSFLAATTFKPMCLQPTLLHCSIAPVRLEGIRWPTTTEICAFLLQQFIPSVCERLAYRLPLHEPRESGMAKREFAILCASEADHDMLRLTELSQQSRK